MNLELALSLAAVVISVFSLGWTILSARRLRVETSLYACVESLLEVKKGIGDVPSVLRFHGIRPEDLRDAGVTAEEFAYLAANFLAGALFYEATDPHGRGEPFDETMYRYKLLAQPETRKAWPLVRKLMDRTSYTRRIDATIDLIERRSAATPRRTGLGSGGDADD